MKSWVGKSLLALLFNLEVFNKVYILQFFNGYFIYKGSRIRDKIG